jgi:hypothetical protein
MSLDKLPFYYKDNQEISYKEENVNHRYLERIVRYHNHDGINGATLENVNISGSLTTDSITIKNKADTLLTIFKSFDSGWIFCDTAGDFKNTFNIFGRDQAHHYATFNHTLGSIPSLINLYTSKDGGSIYSQPIGSVWQTGGGTQMTDICRIYDVTPSTYKIIVGAGAIINLYFRVILIG